MFKFFCFSFLMTGFVFAENSYRMEVYGSSTYQNVNEESRFNPDNSALKIPRWSHILEARPDLQFEFHENQALVLRSRHFLSGYQRDYTNPDRSRTSIISDSDLSDLFISSNWAENLSTNLGLQNYQWGPAEIFSPTNPFFHFDNNQRSFFYKEKGRVLVRANWNPDAENSRWSVVGIYEPVNNQEPYWTADREFKPKSLLKVERQFENPINAVALVFGQGEAQKFFWGEYFTWSPEEGLSLYGDVKHQMGRTHFVPVENGFGAYDMEKSRQDERILTLAVVGFRWEGRFDFRQEFIWNEAGFNRRQWRQAQDSATTLSPKLPQNILRFSRPGLEFRTQSYSYTSLRVPDLGKRKQASAALRWLASLSEDSSALQANWEYNWSDSTVISAEALQFLGRQDTEFRLVSDTQLSLGFRWSY